MTDWERIDPPSRWWDGDELPPSEDEDELERADRAVDGTKEEGRE